jgi:phosphoribosylglycinamide formyltransferase-1
MNQQYRIAIFASGSGTNAEAIASYFEHHPSIQISLIATNNAKAFVLERAKKLNIPTLVFTREAFNEAVVEVLRERQITHIVLAGFLWLIPQSLLSAFQDKIVNIHPALLPKFGGKGMYGMKIHELVCEAKEKETGITIHLINEKYDEGPVLFQGRCDVLETDTPEQVAKKVHQLEYAWYPKIIEKWILEMK